MDIRTEIINNVLQALADQKQEIQERVETVLHIQKPYRSIRYKNGQLR